MKNKYLNTIITLIILTPLIIVTIKYVLVSNVSKIDNSYNNISIVVPTNWKMISSPFGGDSVVDYYTNGVSLITIIKAPLIDQGENLDVFLNQTIQKYGTSSNASKIVFANQPVVYFETTRQDSENNVQDFTVNYYIIKDNKTYMIIAGSPISQYDKEKIILNQILSTVVIK